MAGPAGDRRSDDDILTTGRAGRGAITSLAAVAVARAAPLRCAGRDGHRAGARGGVAVLERLLRGPGSGSPSGPPWWWAAPWRCCSPPAATSSPTPPSALRRATEDARELDSMCGAVPGHERADLRGAAGRPRAAGRTRCSWPSSSVRTPAPLRARRRGDAGGGRRRRRLAAKIGPADVEAGARSGGVEVQFPNGYQAGSDGDDHADAAFGRLAARHARGDAGASPGCGTLTVDFGASDAGSEGAPAPRRRAGAPRRSAGRRGGDRRRRRCGQGRKRGGPRAEAAALPGTGHGRSGGVARNAGGAGGAACKPTGPENCFDGIDNDCNGPIDCADPACEATVAQCVALIRRRPPLDCGAGSGPVACATAGYDQGTAIFAHPKHSAAPPFDRRQGVQLRAGSGDLLDHPRRVEERWRSAPVTRRAESRWAPSSPVRRRAARRPVSRPGRWTPAATYTPSPPRPSMPRRPPARLTARRTRRRTPSASARPSVARSRVGGGGSAGKVGAPAPARRGALPAVRRLDKTTCPGGAPAQPMLHGVFRDGRPAATAPAGTPVGASCDAGPAGRRASSICRAGATVHRDGRLQAGHSVLRNRPPGPARR